MTMAVTVGSEQAATDGDGTGNLSLLERIACGDRVAFGQLFEQYRGQVHAVVVAVLRDQSQAQEVTQEVFLQVWQQASRFDPALSSAATWIRRLARCRAIDRVRVCENAGARDTRYTAANNTVDSDTVIEQVLHREENACLRKALQELRPLQRESIVLAYYAGMSTAEISEQLNTNCSTIKTRIRDGLINLTALLQGDPGIALS